MPIYYPIPGLTWRLIFPRKEEDVHYIEQQLPIIDNQSPSLWATASSSGNPQNYNNDQTTVLYKMDVFDSMAPQISTVD